LIIFEKANLIIYIKCWSLIPIPIQSSLFSDIPVFRKSFPWPSGTDDTKIRDDSR